MSTRTFGLLAGLALLAAGLALPATGQAVKPTASLEFELPDEGQVGFNHLLFKTKKKGKALSRKAATRTKKGSKKLSKKVRAKTKLKGGKGIPADVQVVASVAQIKGQKRTYALDVAVLHAGPGAQPVSAPAARSGGPRGGVQVRGTNPGTILELILFGRGVSAERVQRIILDEPDPDVTADDPSRPAACGPGGGLFADGKQVEWLLNGDLIANLEELADFIALSELLFCDEPIPDNLFPIFAQLDLDEPGPPGGFNCTGVRIGDNTPFGHTFTGGTCNQPIVDIRFEITKPAGGTYFDFSAPFPSCAFANGQRQVHCTSPASSNKMKIQGSAFGTSQPTECVRVTAQNSLGQRFEAVTSTDAFATCP